MSKPLEHAVLSVKKWGGVPEDYLPIHDFMDSSKAHVADMRHRAILHSSFGCYLAEQVFGHEIIINESTDSSGTAYGVSVRDIAEQHIIQDLGFIPSVQQYLDHMEMADWMGGKKKKKFTIQLKGTVAPDGCGGDPVLPDPPPARDVTGGEKWTIDRMGKSVPYFID
tara:strand:+ start:14102 stop:14602 length:501 start_codon:yes stop_codon:yes gene_type:complete